MARKRYAEIIDLHADNPHGIFVDNMQSTRDMLKGFPALSKPDSILDQMRDIGPDEFELAKSPPSFCRG